MVRTGLLQTLLVAVALAATSACAPNDVVAPRDAATAAATPPIVTDRARYVVEQTAGMYRVTIDFQYTNATGAAVYLPTCRSTYPPVLEKRVGSQWVRAYSGPVLVCSGAPQRVAAGATASSTLEVEAGLPGSGLGTQFETTTIEGTYRLVWAIYAGGAVTSSDLDGLMPLEQRISNEFTLSR